MTNKQSSVIIFEGIPIDVKFKSIRTLRLVIRRDGSPMLSIPKGMSEERVILFLKQHKDWIVSKQKEAQERFQKENSEHVHIYQEGEIFTFLGKAYPLHLSLSNCPAQVLIDKDGLWIKSRKHLTPDKIRQILQVWYMKQIQEIIRSLVADWVVRMNERPISEIRFRKMTSRWGSCAPSRRILCFNTRLIYKPIECIEEVVVHELCHLKEASHNPRFHSLMSFYLPDYKQRNKLLNQ